MPPRDPSPLQKTSSLVDAPRNAAPAAASAAVVVDAAGADAVVAAAAPAAAVVHAPWMTHHRRFARPPRGQRGGLRRKGGQRAVTSEVAGTYGIRNR